MDIQKVSEKINQRVYRQFPYLEGKKPEISQLSDEKFSLIYRGEQLTADGHKIPLTIKVTANKSGEIEKLATSK